MGSHRAEPAARLRRSRGVPATRTPVDALPVEATAAAPRRRSATVLGRGGVLTALVAVTVVVPVSQGMADGQVVVGTAASASTRVDGPSTVSALTAMPLSDLPPTALVSADGTPRVRELVASRGEERSALPGCDGSVRPSGENGLLATKDLCTLWDGRTQMRADAAVALAELNEVHIAKFGTDLCLSSGYRTLAQQKAVKAEKGGLAATPGKSNHGWGLAVDLCGLQNSSVKMAWMNEMAGTFGWENPSWARKGGSGPFEPWHWEYTKGVKSDGEYYG
ncbi:MAG: M15 family metallopeptidase [Cellulomonas iranensis]|uniref:M15 family metallopeptidase n=1 Tax=Cellulomonas iranensis TaxID=76862 RepID=UPI001B0CB544|nr:M15 family metallopeptidase [Cellulomonas iranensis]MBO9567539.1 M15 family metallopeptidase [Cellulomonas iranensis]